MIVDKRYGDLHEIRDFLFVTEGVREIAQGNIDEAIEAVLRIQYPFCHGQPNDTHSMSAFLVLDFVLGIWRHSRHQLFDFWQFPHETLLLGMGDCEDTSILLGGLARAGEMNYWVVVGAVYNGEALLGYHAWVHLYLNDRWQLIETTLDETPDLWPGVSGPKPEEIIYKDLRYVPLIFFNHEEVDQVGEFDLAGSGIQWSKQNLRRLKSGWQ